METFSVTLALALCSVVLFYLYRRRKLQVLDKLGLVTAGNPNFVFGNLLEFSGYTLSKRLQQWTKEYGKTYGYYEGPQPVIVSSDLEFLQEIMVKQFGSFNARKLYPIQDDPENDPNMHMFLARNERWKRLRLCANPAFSTAKLKQMFSTIYSCDERFMKNMALNAKQDSFNIYDFYQRFTLDVIFECAFGVSINAQENPSALYLKKLREAFSEMTIPVIVVLAMIFFEIREFLKKFYGVLLSAGILQNPFLYIKEQLIPKIVTVRTEQFAEKANGEKDLIQLMLEAYHSNENKANGVSDATDDAVVSRAQRELSLKEVESQVELFMLAGYETSSTTLAYCTYLLATNAPIQKRLQKEIDAFYESEFGQTNYEDCDSQVLTYDKLIATGKLPFLDLVVLETLRMYPIASNVVTRQCMVSTEVRGITIPAGVNIVPDIWTIHNDPEIWGPEDPKKFHPDRFAPEVHNSRHPLSFLAFGAGPRNCIGMRFALVEVKLTLVRLLRRYDILESAKTEKPLVLREMDVISPKNGVHIRLQARQKVTVAVAVAVAVADSSVKSAHNEAIQA